MDHAGGYQRPCVRRRKRNRCGIRSLALESPPQAALDKVKITYNLPCNGEYAFLEEFANLEKTNDVPVRDLPYLANVSLAKGSGRAPRVVEVNL
jgi:hypothetical protein